MSFWKSKKERVNYKSRSIAIMYLEKVKSQLEEELASPDKRNGENETFTAEHDIKCLEETINYLNKGD